MRVDRAMTRLPCDDTPANARERLDDARRNLTRVSHSMRSRPAFRDDRHSLSFEVAVTVRVSGENKKPPTLRSTASRFWWRSTGFWRPAYGPLGFPLFLRPPGASPASRSAARTRCVLPPTQRPAP